MSDAAEIERAAKLIHDAVDPLGDIWNNEAAFDGRFCDLAEALLAAGWRPPDR